MGFLGFSGTWPYRGPGGPRLTNAIFPAKGLCENHRQVDTRIHQPFDALAKVGGTDATAQDGWIFEVQT